MLNEAEQLINQTKVWGYIHIPAGARTTFGASEGCSNKYRL